MELAVPGAALVLALIGGSVRFFAGWFTGHSAQLLTLLLAIVLLGLAITASLRGCHWLVRVLIHVGWLGSLTLWLTVEYGRFKQLGG